MLQNSDVYKEAQQITNRSHSILLLNHDPGKTNPTPGRHIAPEDIKIKENTSIGKITKLMSAYKSLEVDMARVENSVLGAETKYKTLPNGILGN